MIIIVNWNYRRFVGQAIASVKSQSYRRLECIVVDNGSTDDSLAVIEQSIAGDPRFQVLKLPENLQLLGGAMAGFDLARGEFIVCLDADDILFDTFLACHVQLHLSSARPTSFTSSNVGFIDGEGTLIAGPRRCINVADPIFQPSFDAMSELLVASLSESEYATLKEACYFAPREIDYWFWAPGSPNMFRRELISIFKPEVNTPLPFGGFDTFFHLPLFGLTGINFINLPLGAYRIHGENDFARTPNLEGIKIGNEAAYQRNTNVKFLLLRTLIAKCETLVGLALPPDRYFKILALAARNAIELPADFYKKHLLEQGAAGRAGGKISVFGADFR